MDSTEIFQRRKLIKNKKSDQEAKLDELDKKILSDSVSPGDSSQAATIAAISTSTLSSLEAAQGLIGNDPDSASATVHGDTENRALAALSRVREEVKILDLNISHSGPFSEHEDSNESETYSASLASLLHLQSEVDYFVFRYKRGTQSAVSSEPKTHNFLSALSGTAVLDSQNSSRSSQAELEAFVSRLENWSMSGNMSNEGPLNKSSSMLDEVTFETNTGKLHLAHTTALSPLKTAVEDSELGGMENYSLQRFFNWVFHIQSPLGVGGLQSVHLHREHGFLHHEYVLMCFGGPGIPPSWLRAERAARFKRHRLQSDSFGPIIGGAVLRETITVASSRAELTSGDELAVVEVTRLAPNVPTPQAGAEYPQSIPLRDALEVLHSNSQASDKYRLLTENCRWFARRTMLSLLERLDVAEIIGIYLWKGTLVDSNRLETELEHEWAGGSRLRSRKGVQINAMNIRRLARACVTEKKFDQAIGLCKTGLRKLDDIVPERDNPQFMVLQATLWLTLGDALHWLGRLEEAVVALQHSTQLSRISYVPGAPLRSVSFIIREELALLYTELAQYDKALEIQIPLLNTLRGIYKDRKSEGYDEPRSFSRILVNAAICEYRQALSLSRPVPEIVLIHITESLDINRDLYTRYPDVYGFAFADSLRTQAVVLNAAGFKVEAFKASREAISLLRTVLSSDVYKHTPNDLSNPLIISEYLLPLWLFNHMRFSTDVGHTDEALNVGQEAVTLLRPMHAAAVAVGGSSEFVSGAGSIHKPFGMALYYLGVNMRAAGRLSSDFVAHWREALEVFRLLVQREPGSHQEDLARVLYDLGISVEVPAERFNLLSECVELTRAEHAAHPSDESRDVLLSRLNEYAIVADSIKDWHAASLAEREIIEHLGAPPSNQSDSRYQDVAGITMSLGKHLLFCGKTVHSLEAFEDAARRWQTLYTFNPETHRQTYIELAQCASLNATVLKSSGYYSEALRSFDLAVGIWVEIGKTRPGTHLADIAQAAEQVGHIAEHFSDTGRPSEALRASEKAARIRKSL